MGLPHVLVRFYTNPDGTAARRTALAVIALLSLFYLFPTLLGVFARQFVPQLLITGTADAAVLLLPSAAIGGRRGRGPGGAGGRRRDRRVPRHVVGTAGQHRGRAVDRRAARPGPRLPGRSGRRWHGADSAGAAGVRRWSCPAASDWSFAVAASTLCPLLVLGIWWRGLTSVGAACGLVVGGVASGVATTLAVAGGIDDDCSAAGPRRSSAIPPRSPCRWRS